MAPLAPHARPSRRRRLKARLGRARRKAAVVTSAALLASGAGVAVAPAVLDAPAAPVRASASAEAPTVALLPPPVVAVSDPAPAAEPAAEPVAEPATPASGKPLPGGRASYYGAELAGNPTASGEPFDPSEMTAAHRTLPLGTRVRVTHARTGESVVVRVNDRGPFHDDRVIDVSRAAADEIGLTRAGTAEVELERLPKRGARG